MGDSSVKGFVWAFVVALGLAVILSLVGGIKALLILFHFAH